MIKHTEGKWFKCNTCDFASKSQPELKRHEMIHGGIKSHNVSAISATTPPPDLKISEVMLRETMALSTTNAVSVTMLLIEKTPF